MSLLEAELEVRSLYDNAPEPQAAFHSKEMQYWKLCEREDCTIHYQQKGWVVTGPALSPKTAVEWSDFMTTKHATPLTQYGKQSSGSMFKPITRFDELIKQGGIGQIPLDQMAAYKWHLIPKMVAAYPALADVQVLLCEHGCATRGPRMRTFNTEESRMKHYKVMHQDVVGPTLIGKQFAAARNEPVAIPPEYWAQVALIVKEALAGDAQPVKKVSGGSND